MDTSYIILAVLAGSAVSVIVGFLAVAGPRLRATAMSLAERAAHDYAAIYRLARIGVTAAKQRSWQFMDSDQDGSITVHDWMFAYADRFLSVAAPWLPVDSRQTLIEAAVAGLNDAGAVIDDLPQAGGDVVKAQAQVTVPAAH